MDAQREVVVTGVGVVSPGGGTLAETWDFLLSGRSAAASLDPATVCDSTTSFGCMVGDYPEDAVPAHLARKLERVTRLTGLAADQAIDQARLRPPNEVCPDRVAVAMGVALGGLQTFETLAETLNGKGYEGVSNFSVVRMMPNAAAAWLAMQHGWTGPCNTVLTACASGASAIAHGVDLIQSEKADVVVAGGADAPVLRSVLATFGRMRALSRRNDEPERASRPFDTGRDGFVLGEGAAVVVLEREDHARARRVKALGTILGTAANCDAFDLAAPSPSGEGARRCMADALASAGLLPEDIGHINAHGTSTSLNDLNEAKAIERVFGDPCPPVTANKGSLGHAIGGAGAIEAVVTLTSSSRGVVPPTANCDEVDPEVHIDVARRAPRTIPRGMPALSNSFGFGGHNVCLVVVGADDEA
ncbi:MAG: beta-ketoacyl-[acyl-carrier-protein] synthase family protein [Acidimicrobiales bacterium]